MAQACQGTRTSPGFGCVAAVADTTMVQAWQGLADLTISRLVGCAAVLIVCPLIWSQHGKGLWAPPLISRAERFLRCPHSVSTGEVQARPRVTSSGCGAAVAHLTIFPLHAHADSGNLPQVKHVCQFPVCACRQAESATCGGPVASTLASSLARQALSATAAASILTDV